MFNGRSRRAAAGKRFRHPRRGDHWLRARGPRLAVALSASVVVGGTAGYMLIERWSFLDALYMTVITVATVGYREVGPPSTAGMIFTMLLIVAGVGTAFYTFTLLATLIVDGSLMLRFEERRRNRMLGELTNHFILCGHGRIGSIIAAEFRKENIPYVVIDRDEDRVHDLIERGELAVAADASREEVLKRVGIDRARGLIAAVGTDAENVYTILTARGLRPDLYIIGRAETEDGVRKLGRAGANRVLSPYQIGAVQMAQTALRPAVVDFVQLATSSDNLELAMEQIKLAERTELAGRSLTDANLRQRFGVVVVGIQRADGHMQFNPPADAVLMAGDQLVVLGRPENLKELEVAAAG